MKPSEKAKLNKDIKALANEIFSLSFGDNKPYFDYLEGAGKLEYLRLYRLDDTFEHMSKNSVVIMMRLNLSHRFVPFHQFGIKVVIQHII